MREWATLLLLVGAAWPAMAAKTLSMEQMEQLLVKLHGKPDGKVAGELEDVELTERVSLARLERWEKDLPGSRAHEALMKLADVSAFLNPPGSDVVPDPPPDTETQQRMLRLAVQYVKATITRLPNFYATRETTHFEDAPSRDAAYPERSHMSSGTYLGVRRTEYKPLRSTGTSSVQVTYRNGYEVRDAQPAKSGEDSQPTLGLTTIGEFGPILSVVIGDAMRNEVTWLRWEEGASEPMGVFCYAVPEDQSNYTVRMPTGAKMEELHPAYHGEVAIDPGTGAIIRVSVVAELPRPHKAVQTAIMVEYAPVEIGDRSYICPVRGVALSKIPVADSTSTGQGSGASLQTQLNDVAFTHYHVFRTESRIVGDQSETGR